MVDNMLPIGVADDDESVGFVVVVLSILTEIEIQIYLGRDKGRFDSYRYRSTVM
jgi:hypothetical protein